MSRPSAKEGVQNLVLAITSGAWNGNLSLSRISKLNLSLP